MDLVVITDDTTLPQGESILLSCVGFGLPYADVTWSRNGAPLMLSTSVSTFEEDLIEGGRTYRRSSLQLCSVTMEDSGSYDCYVTNGEDTVNSSIVLSVSGNGLCMQKKCNSQLKPSSFT